MGNQEENDRQNEEIRDHMSKGGRAEPNRDSRIKKEVVDDANRRKPPEKK
jgi:hypothetical protein